MRLNSWLSLLGESTDFVVTSINTYPMEMSSLLGPQHPQSATTLHVTAGNAAFRCYYLRQKLLHDVCHQFRMTGKQTVVFFGTARFNLSSRGHPSTTPLALIRRGDRMDANAGGWMRTLEDGCERWRMDANAGARPEPFCRG